MSQLKQNSVIVAGALLLSIGCSGGADSPVEDESPASTESVTSDGATGPGVSDEGAELEALNDENQVDAVGELELADGSKIAWYEMAPGVFMIMDEFKLEAPPLRPRKLTLPSEVFAKLAPTQEIPQALVELEQRALELRAQNADKVAELEQLAQENQVAEQTAGAEARQGDIGSVQQAYTYSDLEVYAQCGVFDILRKPNASGNFDFRKNGRYHTWGGAAAKTGTVRFIVHWLNIWWRYDWINQVLTEGSARRFDLDTFATTSHDIKMHIRDASGSDRWHMCADGF